MAVPPQFQKKTKATATDPDAAQDAKAAQLQKGSLRQNAKRRAKPNAKAPLGQGGRFAAVAAQAAKSGASNPAAVAAAIGRKKYGGAKMAQMAAAGRRGK